MNDLNKNKSLAPIEPLTLTEAWDKTFPKSDKVDHKKVEIPSDQIATFFNNRMK